MIKVQTIRRVGIHKWLSYLSPIASIILALSAGAILILLTGNDPVFIYRAIFGATFSSKYNFTETIVKAIPLMISGLAVSLAFRMRLWNIGVEGQFYMGAISASGLALFFPNLPITIMLPGMFLAGFLAGGMWGLLAALPKALLNINEVITTLMLNNIAVLFAGYLVYGPWGNPEGFNFPLSARFIDAAQLPTIAGTRVHSGLLIAIIIAFLLLIILRRTRWGYEIRVIGSSSNAARFAGMPVLRNILLVMFLSGGIAGIAGMTEVSGVIHRLQPDISQGYGFTAIVIASLAHLHPVGILLVSFLFGMLLVGSYAVQAVGVSAAIAGMLQGAILFSVLVSDFFLNYKIRIVQISSVSKSHLSKVSQK